MNHQPSTRSKWPWFVLLCLSAAAALAAETAAIPEIEGPRAAYHQALAKIRAERDQKSAEATRVYAARLLDLHKKLTDEGETAAAEAVKLESDRVAKGIEPTNEERRKMTGLLLATRVLYEKNRGPAYMEAAKSEAQAHAAWSTGLGQLEQHLTRQRQFAKVLIVRAERAKVEAAKAQATAAATPPANAETPAHTGIPANAGIPAPAGTPAPVGTPAPAGTAAPAGTPPNPGSPVNAATPGSAKTPARAPTAFALDELRANLRGTRWHAPNVTGHPPEKHWFSLEQDGTTRAGWHGRKGKWQVRPDGQVSISYAWKRDHEIIVQFAPDLQSATYEENGPLTLRRLPNQD